MYRPDIPLHVLQSFEGLSIEADCSDGGEVQVDVLIGLTEYVGDLPDILGFGRGDAVVTLTSPARSSVARGYSIVDLRRGFESLYVYSSIVEPRIVGDKIAPLLRIVPITGRHGEMVAARFDHVQYMPVLSREFEAVEIEIRDDTSRPVPFERGKVTVTLHLRRRRTGLF